MVGHKHGRDEGSSSSSSSSSYGKEDDQHQAKKHKSVNNNNNNNNMVEVNNKEKKNIFSLSQNNFEEIFSFLLIASNNLDTIDKCLSQIYGLYLYNNSYIRLNKNYSIIYYENEEFRNMIKSRVINPRNQLSLDLRDFDNITDVSVLGVVHSLKLCRCNNITDVSSLGKVTNLNLSG